jgi:hypothetical protein
LTATRKLEPDIDSAAISGRSTSPNAGSKTPAAIGILGSQAPDDRVADVLAYRAEQTADRLVAIIDADPAGRAFGFRLAELLDSRGQPLHVVEPPDRLDLNGWSLKSRLWTIELAPKAPQPIGSHETRLDHVPT